MTDYVARLKGGSTDTMPLVYARWISIAIGVAVILLSNFIELVPGNIMEVTNKTVNLLSVPIFLVVAYAVFLKAYSSKSVFLGTIASIVVAMLCAFSGPIFGYDPISGLDPISFQYIGPISLAVGLVTSYGSDLFFRFRGS
jgi:Na+(H+)/acetate symporter ActP